jgi:hypothetical protein
MVLPRVASLGGAGGEQMGDDVRAEWTRIEEAIEGYADQHFEKRRNLEEASDPIQVLLSLRMDALDAVKRWAESGRLEVRHGNGVVETHDWPYLKVVETYGRPAPEVAVTCTVLDERSGVVIPHLIVNTSQWECLVQQSLEQRAPASAVDNAVPAAIEEPPVPQPPLSAAPVEHVIEPAQSASELAPPWKTSRRSPI